MPTPSEVILTKEEKCVNCLACIRICPVKSVMFSKGFAQVFEEKCIYCGQCLIICPEKAFYYQSELEKARELVKNKRTVAILAPEYVVSFYPLSNSKAEAGLEKLGFFSVEDTILADELLAYEYEKLIKKTPFDQPLVRSTCSVVVKLVQKHFPEVIPFLAPLVSSPIAMGRLIKEIYADEVATVYIGPCVAEKVEAQEPEVNDALDAVLTFPELKNWFGEERIDLTSLPPPSFEKVRPTLLRMFSVRGGFPRSILRETSLLSTRVKVLKGIGEIHNFLKAMTWGKTKPALVDYQGCDCCVDGPFIDAPLSLYARKNILQEYYREKSKSSIKKVNFLQLLPRLPHIKLEREFENQEAAFPLPTEEELKKILADGGKTSEDDLYDCRACGYLTCREKATAIYQGIAHWEMCFPFQKKLFVKVTDELRKLSVVDSLTNFLNHKSFMRQLEIEFNRAKRYQHPLALLMADIDGFKAINDNYGHLVGDKVLQEVAKAIKRSLRATDISGRYGGDEFILCLPETGLADALIVAEKLRKNLSQKPIQVDRLQFETSLSIGLTAFRPELQNTLEMVEEADKALYAAKRRGKNRICLAKGFLEETAPSYLTEENLKEVKEILKKLGLDEF